MTAAQQRKVQRAAHLTAGLLIVAYIYGPNSAQFHNPIRFIFLPLLVLTGLAMWQAPRIRRLRKSMNGARRGGSGGRTLQATARLQRSPTGGGAPRRHL